MNKAYKFIIYPDSEQRTMLSKAFGCTRMIYNHYLDKRIKLYEEEKITKAEYKNINKTAKVRKLKKKKRRLQCRISEKYSKNKKGVCYRKTCNIIESEKQLLKINHRLTNICHDHIHKATSEIVSRQPNIIENGHDEQGMEHKSCFYNFL